MLSFVPVIPAQSPLVIPAQAGIQTKARLQQRHWIPACAGMTRVGFAGASGGFAWAGGGLTGTGAGFAETAAGFAP